MKKVSVIVPVYKAEKHIERCAVSLFEQDFEDIEYIFVNDDSPDNSIDVLQKTIKDYPARQPHIKIINHVKNKGLGAARRTGLKNATGEYIMHIDDDDWCELDMISSLYTKAQETNADIVICDAFFNSKDKEVYGKQEYAESVEDNLRNLLRVKINAFVWNKLVKHSLYKDNNIYSPTEINMAEDRWLVTRLFLVATSIVYVPRAFYHYWQDNPDSICSKTSAKTWDDLRWYVKTTQMFLEEKGVYEKYKDLFLINNLAYVLWLLKGSNYKATIKYVSPESDKLKYLWQLHKLKFSTKLIFSFYVLNLAVVAIVLTRCRKALKLIVKKK